MIENGKNFLFSKLTKILILTFLTKTQSIEIAILGKADDLCLMSDES